MLGSSFPPFYKHTSMEPLSGFLFSFQMCTKVSSAAESNYKREIHEGCGGSQNALTGWVWAEVPVQVPGDGVTLSMETSLCYASKHQDKSLGMQETDLAHFWS